MAPLQVQEESATALGVHVEARPCTLPYISKEPSPCGPLHIAKHACSRLTRHYRPASCLQPAGRRRPARRQRSASRRSSVCRSRPNGPTGPLTGTGPLVAAGPMACAGPLAAAEMLAAAAAPLARSPPPVAAGRPAGSLADVKRVACLRHGHV